MSGQRRARVQPRLSLPPPPVVVVAPPVAQALMIRPEDRAAIDYIAHNVLFNSGSDQFRDSSYAALDTLAARLMAHPEWHLAIEGHTDGSGLAAKNMLLSQNRADAIRGYQKTRVFPGTGSPQPAMDPPAQSRTTGRPAAVRPTAGSNSS